jgi:hypothetical protein
MSSIVLYYWEDQNIFIDEYGEVVYDLFHVITPHDLYMFRELSMTEHPMVGYPEITVYIRPIVGDEALYWVPDIDIERFMYTFTNLRSEK